MFSTSTISLSASIPEILDVVVIAIGVVAIILNDKLAGIGLIAAGSSLLAKEQGQ